MKLDFVCIGAQKAGTTSLHDILNTHPDIYLPPRKEAQFFDINERYEKGLDFYFSNFFNTYQGEKHVGNINPNLQMENRTIDRIIDCFGTDIKIIFILRDPVKRAFSHYLMSKRRGYEDLPFLEAIEKENYRLKNPKQYPNYISQELGHYEKNHLGYIYRSHYFETIKHLYDSLPKENVKLLLFEDFIANKKETIANILDYLKIPVAPGLQYDIKSNSASAPRNAQVRDFIYKPSPVKKIIGKMFSKKKKELLKKKINSMNKKSLQPDQKMIAAEDRKRIFNIYFKEEVLKIEKLTQLDCSLWKP